MLRAAALLFPALLAASPTAVLAQNATWFSNPPTNQFNGAPNWTAGIPTGTATFGASATTAISLGPGSITVGGFQFDSGGPAYTFTGTSGLTFTGTGIVNNSSSAPAIGMTGANIAFTNSAAAGDATLTANSSGGVVFSGNSSGGTARLILNTGTSLGISGLAATGTTVGSIEGAGNVTLGAKQLTTGGNNLSTTASGAISGAGGALVKAGSGTLSLTGANTYTGGTTISGGTLAIGAGGTTGTIAGNVANNAALAFNRSNALTYAGAISGTGSLSQIGSGTTTLTGANSYTGGTTVSAGILEVGAGLATGSIVGDVTNNATLRFARSNAYTFAGVISGTGAVSLTGTSTTTFTGNSTYGGGTTIASGTLQIGNGGTSGAFGAGATTNSGSLIANRSDGFTIASAISGTGSFAQAGTGTTILTGNNLYTGGTTISAGTLQLGAGGTTGWIEGNVTNNGALVFNRSDTKGADTNISGSGSVTQAGTGTTIMTQNNTYTGGTTISAGTLQIGSGGVVRGSITGDVTNNARIAFNRGNTLVYGGAISGTGALAQIGVGTTILTGANTYSGGTTISNGTLQIGNGGTAGALGTGATVNSGILRFNRSDTMTIASAISGTGSIVQAGTGTTILTGTNTYTGTTTVDAGRLLVGTGSTAGSLAGNVVNNATIAFDSSGNTTYSGTISGTGALTQSGTGTTILSGTNTYSGATTVSAGRLAINGSISSNVTVGSGGNLGGSGTITGSVTNNGTLAPGNSIGTLTVNGSYTQAAGSTYQVEVNATGQSDRINVTGTPGTATIQGGTVAVQAAAGAYGRRTTYTILNATGGVSGTYSNVTSNFAFLTPSLSYDANNVFLTLLLSQNAFAAGAQTSNQRAVGTVLDQTFSAASGDFGTVLNTLAGLGTGQGPAALDAISGQQYSGFATANLASGLAFMNAVGQQMSAARGGPGSGSRLALAGACDVACEGEVASPWSVWASALGGNGSVAGNGNGNASTLTYNNGGFAGGVDRRVGSNLLLGAGLGYLSGNQWVNGFNGRGTSDSYQASLYASFASAAFYLDAMAGYAYNDNQMTRQIVIPGLQPRTATGRTGAGQLLGQAEAGYKFDIHQAAAASLTPFARFQATSVSQGGFTESGASSLNLSVMQQTTNSMRSVVGAELAGAFDLGWRDKLALQLRLGWAHEYADTARPVTASLAGAPGLNFTVLGAAPQRDAAVIGLAANTAVAGGTAVYLRYDGELGTGTDSHALSAGLRISW